MDLKTYRDEKRERVSSNLAFAHEGYICRDHPEGQQYTPSDTTAGVWRAQGYTVESLYSLYADD